MCDIGPGLSPKLGGTGGRPLSACLLLSTGDPPSLAFLDVCACLGAWQKTGYVCVLRWGMYTHGNIYMHLCFWSTCVGATFCSIPSSLPHKPEAPTQTLPAQPEPFGFLGPKILYPTHPTTPGSRVCVLDGHLEPLAQAPLWSGRKNGVGLQGEHRVRVLALQAAYLGLTLGTS